MGCSRGPRDDRVRQRPDALDHHGDDVARLDRRDARGCPGGDEVARPNSIVSHREHAAIEIGDLAETLECVPRLLGGTARRAEHLLLIFVRIAEVVFEQDVQRKPRIFHETYRRRRDLR